MPKVAAPIAPAIRKASKHWTPDEVAEAVQLYEDGMSMQMIAHRLGGTRDQIRRHLLRAGVESRQRVMSEEERSRAAELYVSGMSYREVVRQLGYSCTIIYRLLMSVGVMGSDHSSRESEAVA